MKRITKREYERRIGDLGYIGPYGAVGTDRAQIALDTEDGMLLYTREELVALGTEFVSFLVLLPDDLNDLVGKPDSPMEDEP